MSLLSDANKFRQEIGLTKKSLGQHFLIDENVSKKIVKSLTRFHSLIEVGPGIGALTRYLPKSESITLIEKDKRCIKWIEDFGFKVIEGDVLKIDNPYSNEKYSIIGNLPYNVASLIFIKFYYHEEKIPEEFVAMIQKEVAERILMKKEKPNVLGILINFICDVEKVLDVSKQCFSPPPKVESSVIKIVKRKELSLTARKKFLEIVNLLFGKRRKKISTITKNLDINIPKDFLDKRAEELSIEDWDELLQLNCSD